MNDAFSELYQWFDADALLMDYKPANGGWSIREILEHVSLTNHYLLILIRKGTGKAIERSARAQQNADDYMNDYVMDWDALNQVAQPGAFTWQRPEHMQPQAKMTLNEIADTLKLQEQECLSLLDSMKNGEGTHYKIRMTVNAMGKIDMYHYLYFLV